MSRAHLREKLVQGSAESPDSSVVLCGGRGGGGVFTFRGVQTVCTHTHPKNACTRMRM